MLERLRPRSLKARLTLTTVVGVTLLLVVMSVGLYVALTRELGSAIDAGLRTRADDVLADLPASGDVAASDPLAQTFTADGRLLSTSPGRTVPLLSPAQVAAAAKGSQFYDVATLRAGNEDGLRVLARPVRAPGEAAVLAIGASRREVEDAEHRLVPLLLIGTPLLVLVFALAGRLVLSAALRPVDLLVREADAITETGRPKPLPPIQGDDEIAHLGRTLDSMLRRLEVSFERERAFVDDASHELRTPLAVLRGELELALAATDDPAEVRRCLRSALAETERLSLLADDLLVLARERAGAGPQRQHLVDLRELAQACGSRLSREGVVVQTDGPTVLLLADERGLERVITNLVTNAVTAGATRVRLAVSADESLARLEVEDDGHGFPPELLRSAFERFTRADSARTRGAGSGAGLGLAMVAEIARSHGGSAHADNDSSLGGARVTVTFTRDDVHAAVQPTGRPGAD